MRRNSSPTRHETPWGAAINFDGPGSRTVRDFLPAQRAVLARRVPLRRAATRCGACHLRRQRASTSSANSLTAVRRHACWPARAPRAGERPQRGALPGARSRHGRAVHCRRAMERRRAPCAARDHDRRDRRLLRRLRRPPAPTARPLPRRRLCLPGRALGVPWWRAARRAERPAAPKRVRHLHADARPGRQPCVRRAPVDARRCRRAAAGRGGRAAVAVGADAVHGRGVRRVDARFCSSATSDPSWRPPSRAAGATSSAASTRFRDPASQAAIPDPNDFGDVSLPAASTGPRSVAHRTRQWRAFYASLLRKRAAHITPLLDGTAAGGSWGVEGHVLRVDWPLAGGSSLHLIGNFGEHCVGAAAHGDADPSAAGCAARWWSARPSRSARPGGRPRAA